MNHRPPLFLALVLGLAYWVAALALLVLGLAEVAGASRSGPGSASAYILVLAGGTVLEAGNQVWSRSAVHLDVRPVEGLRALVLVAVALVALAFPGGVAALVVVAVAVVGALDDLRSTPGAAQVTRGLFLVVYGVFAVAALILSVGESTAGSSTSEVVTLAVLALAVWGAGVGTSEAAREALEPPVRSESSDPAGAQQ